MIDRARLTIPYLDGTVTEWLDTGSGFVSQGEINRMLADRDNTWNLPSSTLAYPNAHTLRLRISLPEARAVDRIIVEGLDQASGLTYSIDRGDGVSMTTIVTSTAVTPEAGYSEANIVERITPAAATTYDILFTGFTQQLKISGIMLGHEYWEPHRNYDFGGDLNNAHDHRIFQKGDGYGASRVIKGRERSLPFTEEPQEKYEELSDFFRVGLFEGYCLFEQNQTDTKNTFLAVVTSPRFRHAHFGAYSFSFDAKEVNACQ